MDISPAPSGATKIEVTFHIDASGIVYLSAKDVATDEAKESEEIFLYKRNCLVMSFHSSCWYPVIWTMNK